MTDYTEILVAFLAGGGLGAGTLLSLFIRRFWAKKQKVKDADCGARHHALEAKCKDKHAELKAEVHLEVKERLEKTYDLLWAMMNCMCRSDAQFRENWREWYAKKFGYQDEARKDR